MTAIKDFAYQRIEQCLNDLNRLRELKNTLVAGVSKAAEDYNVRSSTLVNARKDVLDQENGDTENKTEGEEGKDEDEDKDKEVEEGVNEKSSNLGASVQPVQTNQTSQPTPIPQQPVQPPTTVTPTQN